MKKEGSKKSIGKEDISTVAQPLQAPAPSPLLSEARSLPKSYWIRVSIGLLCVIFFSVWVPNAYLQYRYSDVFSESPCKLCQDLNNQTEGCFFNQSYSIIPETEALTLHPFKEMGFKARWLQIPCDVCGQTEGGRLATCLNETFAPKKQETKNNLSFDFSQIKLDPVEGISS